MKNESDDNNSVIDDTQNKYHWYSTDNTDCVSFTITNDELEKREWLQLLSLISTRFIQVSWRILHDLQIAPPSNTYHLYNHDEWVMVEINYNGVKTVSCIQTIKQNGGSTDPKSSSSSSSTSSFIMEQEEFPLIRFSPLIITDLHLSYTFNPNNSSLIALNNMNKIGLRSIDFHNFPIAKTVRFQIISSLSYTNISDDDSTVNYDQIVTKYLSENKINDIELMKDDYYVHHKCIWKDQIVAIPMIDGNQIGNGKKKQKPTSLRGKAALKHFYLNKTKATIKHGYNTTKYNLKHWIYIRIVDIEKTDEFHPNEISEYYRILPTVTKFMKIEQNGNIEQPRLCEYYSSILLDTNKKINGDNLYYNYKIPTFYENILQNILFPNVYYKYQNNNGLSMLLKNINVNPSFLVIANKGHRLQQNLENMARILGVNYVYKNCIELLDQNMSATVQRMKNFLKSALEYKPLVLHLDNLQLFEFEANIHSFYNTSGKIKPILPIVNAIQEFLSRNVNNSKIILFGQANNISKITRELRAIFTYEHVIESIFDDDHKCDTEIIPQSLENYISELNLINGLNTTQLFEIIHHSKDPQNPEKLQDIIDNIRYRQSLYNINLNINVSSIPSVKWADVGGLETAKQEILNIIKLPLQYANVFANIKQSIGILLYGPPGTGM